MPALSEFEYGGDATKVEFFLENLNTHVQNVMDAINSLTDVENAVNSNWAGKSKDKFLEAMKVDAQSLSEAIQLIYVKLGNEFANVMQVMQEHDLQMFKD